METTTDVSDSNYTYSLMDICYRGIELMFDEELARAEKRWERLQYIPKDYLHERDRNWLKDLASYKEYMKVGGVSS